MSERPYFSDNPNIYTKGTYVSFSSDNISNVIKLLEIRSSSQRLISIDDVAALPNPIQRIELDSYWLNDYSEEEDDDRAVTSLQVLTACMDIDPTRFSADSDISVVNLLASIDHSFKNHSDFGIEKLAHDPLALYLTHDSHEAIRVHFASSPDQLSIIISNYDTQKIGGLNQLDQAYTPTSEVMLKHVTEGMTIVIDTLHSLFRDGNDANSHFDYSFAKIGNEELATAKGGLAQLAILQSNDVRIEGMPSEAEMIVKNKKDFDSLGGLSSAKSRLIEIGDSYVDREVSEIYGIKPKPVLLYGPPGTGKSSLAKAMSKYVDAEFLSIRSKDIIDKYIGESPKQLSNIFKDAYELSDKKRVVLFLDEIDAYATKRAQSQAAAYVEAQKELQQQISEELPNHPNVFLVAATNADIDDISEALTRSGRFEKIFVGMPNTTELIDIWAVLLERRGRELDKSWDSGSYIGSHRNPIKLFDIRNDANYDSLTDEAISATACIESVFDIPKLAQLTNGATGATVSDIIDSALSICYQLHRKTGDFQPMTQAVLEQAIEQVSHR